MFFCLGFAHITNAPEGIIILGPVYDGQVTPKKSRLKQIAIGNSPISKEAVSCSRIKTDFFGIALVEAEKAVLLLRLWEL